MRVYGPDDLEIISTDKAPGYQDPHHGTSSACLVLALASWKPLSSVTNSYQMASIPAEGYPRTISLKSSFPTISTSGQTQVWGC